VQESVAERADTSNSVKEEEEEEPDPWLLTVSVVYTDVEELANMWVPTYKANFLTVGRSRSQRISRPQCIGISTVQEVAASHKKEA